MHADTVNVFVASVSTAPGAADLDGRESDGGATGTCNAPDGGDPVATRDTPGGGDNAGYYAFATLTADPEKYLGANRIAFLLYKGLIGWALRISEYDGTANDDRVVVSTLPLRGLYDRVNPIDGSDPTAVARHGDKTDCWVADSDYLVPGTQEPMDVSTGGRVVDGVLEVTLPELVFRVPLLGADVSPPLVVRLRDVMLRANLVFDTTDGGADFALRGGVVAGRWDAADYLGQLSRLTVKAGPLCTDPTYAALQQNFCKYRDLAAARADDVCDISMPRADCAAISTYFTFDTYPILYPDTQAAWTGYADPSSCPDSTRVCVSGP